MKKCLFGLILSFFVTLVFAAPTIEGLFRNGNNQDVTSDLIIATFSVEELPTEVSKELLPTRYVKLFMSRSGGSIEIVETDYADNRFLDASAVRSSYKNLLGNERVENKGGERSLFYSVLGTLLLNDSRLMNDFLKANTTSYKTNKELMNPEKIALLQKYKDYLVAVSEEGGSVSEAIKASKQTSTEERTKALEVIAAGVYDKTDKVHLSREEGQFYWSIDLTQFKALFSNEEHRLKKIKFTSELGKEVELECGEYVLINGTHELPRTISLRDFSNSLYRINFLTLTHVKDKSGQVARANKYEGLVKANKNKNIATKFTQSFLF